MSNYGQLVFVYPATPLCNTICFYL